MGIILFIAAAKLLIHCYFNNRYGYFRDEFDYMACGDPWPGICGPTPADSFLIHVCRAVLGDRRAAYVLSQRWRLHFWWYRRRCWPANLADGHSPFC
jgi:hypothetical protein